MAQKRKPRIVERKLGREGNYGQHWPDTHLIEVDPRQKARTYMDTLIHELLHAYFPEAAETRVTKVARAMTHYLWEARYRRVMK